LFYDENIAFARGSSLVEVAEGTKVQKEISLCSAMDIQYVCGCMYGQPHAFQLLLMSAAELKEKCD